MGESSCMYLVALVDEIFDVCLDPPDSIADEADPHLRIEPGQGLYQTHVPFLHNFKWSVSQVKISLGNFHDKTQVCRYNFLSGRDVTLFVLSGIIELFFWGEQLIIFDLSGVELKIRRRKFAPHRSLLKKETI